MEERDILYLCNQYGFLPGAFLQIIMLVFGLKWEFINIAYYILESNGKQNDTLPDMK